MALLEPQSVGRVDAKYSSARAGVNIAARHSWMTRVYCVLDYCPGASLCGHPRGLVVVHMSSVTMREATADAYHQPLGRIIARLSISGERVQMWQKGTLPSIAR
jgi:hypothetical protein